MKRRFLFSVLMAGLMAFNFASCKDDDDDDNKGDGKTPQKDVNFVVSTQANEVSITTTLVAEQMWVDINNQSINFVDGVATINLPIKGEYEATVTSLINGETSTSDVFTITIEESDLSFLNKGILKLLSGGESVYSTAAETADANGVYTRTWHIDGFQNNSGVGYSKMFKGPGTFCLERDTACYNGGVAIDGNGSWRSLGAIEDATISFDVVNQKVKVVFTDANKLNVSAAGATIGDEVPLSGTYYGTFTYTSATTNSDFLSVIDGWAGVTTDVEGIEITLSGENVRIPYLKSVISHPLATADDVTKVKLFANKNDDNAEGLMILTAVSYNTAEGEDGASTIKDDYCNIMMTYVAEELESTYKYEVPEEEIAGQWESHIAFWGDNDWNAEGIATIENVTVTGDGEYTYTATINAESTYIEYFCIHFDSGKSYATFTADGVNVEVESLTINGEASTDANIKADSYELVGADGGTAYYRIQFYSGDWNFDDKDGSTLKAGDVISIKVKISGL